ncbi:MAG: ABC transporter permease [Candidatus Sumerlaeia bacterium]|nr:ABC transporter permease [Candidatus Sumerlaeia bacterium]
MLQDVLKSRPVVWMLVRRELKSRYAGSTIGGFWNLIHPIVMMAVYVVVFSQVMAARMGEGAGRLDYTVHLCSGIVMWFLFNEILGRGSGVLVENANMLKKMALPEEVLFISVYITSMLVSTISFLALILFFLAVGVPLGPEVLFVFPIMAVLGLVAVGLSMTFSVLNLLVRDVGQIVQIGLLLTFWSLPIVYLPSILPESVESLINLNPVKGYFSLTQYIFGSPESGFNPDSYWTMTLLPFLALVTGIAFLRKNRSEILDSI